MDGQVTDCDLATGLSLWARWVSFSGMPFDAGRFLVEHPQCGHLEAAPQDRPTRAGEQ